MYIMMYQGDYTATFITCSYNMLFIILGVFSRAAPDNSFPAP